MQSKIQQFVQSLQLVPDQNQSLISNLERFQTKNGSTMSSDIDLACEVAQACLEVGSVETKPVNPTEADANWLVVPLLRCSRLPNADYITKGRKHVGQRHHAY